MEIVLDEKKLKNALSAIEGLVPAPHRIILQLLIDEGEMEGKQLAARVGIKERLVQLYLQRLFADGFIIQRPIGLDVYYSAIKPRIELVVQFTNQLDAYV